MISWLLEFRFDKEILKDESSIKELINNVTEKVGRFLTNFKVVYEAVNGDLENNGFALFMQNLPKCTMLMLGSPNGLLTIDINVANDCEVNEEVVDELRQSIFKIDYIFKRKTLEFKRLPAIKRGREFSVYDTTSYNSLTECDYDKIVFDENSRYQNVRIMHSPQFGNVLILDNDMNLAESDLAYTIAITGNNQEDYNEKDVLVLGGGDGGILNYLINGNVGCPKMVTMVDIDEVVIKAAQQHLRGICGNALDKYEGDNYKVIVGDCVEYLKQYVEEGRKFDYIINDLTAIPISTTPVGTHWDFLRLILSLSFSVLKDDGKYFTQGNGANNKQALKMYECQLEQLNPQVDFSSEVVCVPSYLELWVFYTIQKKKEKCF